MKPNRDFLKRTLDFAISGAPIRTWLLRHLLKEFYAKILKDKKYEIYELA